MSGPHLNFDKVTRLFDIIGEVAPAPPPLVYGPEDATTADTGEWVLRLARLHGLAWDCPQWDQLTQEVVEVRRRGGDIAMPRHLELLRSLTPPAVRDAQGPMSFNRMIELRITGAQARTVLGDPVGILRRLPRLRTLSAKQTFI